MKDDISEMLSEDDRGYLVMVELLSPVLVLMLSPLLQLLLCILVNLVGSIGVSWAYDVQLSFVIVEDPKLVLPLLLCQRIGFLCCCWRVRLGGESCVV